jgi:hypothetical protein
MAGSLCDFLRLPELCASAGPVLLLCGCPVWLGILLLIREVNKHTGRASLEELLYIASVSVCLSKGK